MPFEARPDPEISETKTGPVTVFPKAPETASVDDQCPCCWSSHPSKSRSASCSFSQGLFLRFIVSRSLLVRYCPHRIAIDLLEQHSASCAGTSVYSSPNSPNEGLSPDMPQILALRHSTQTTGLAPMSCIHFIQAQQCVQYWVVSDYTNLSRLEF
jgi:hypothetical protein